MTSPAEGTQAYDWRGRTVGERNGDKIAKLDEIYLAQESGQPGRALVHTGLCGSRPSPVPLTGAGPAGDDVAVNWEKSVVKDAPNVEADGDLSHEEEAALYRHYGLDYGVPAETPRDTGQDTSG